MIEESNIPWRQEQTRDQVLPTEMNQEDKNLINTIREKMENISCSKCICRVPPLHSRDDPEKYFPKLISIGPFHHGKPGLEFMEEQKWRYLNAFLSRSRTPESTLEKCMKAMRDIEHRARKCYREETIHADEFVKTMLLDGCFIVELFLKYTIKGLRRRDDPCFISNQRFFRLRCDLILLENQMPFFVLQKLFQIVPLPKQCSHTLTELAFHFFRRMIPGDILFLQDKFGQGYFSHFLDLIRQCYLPDQTAPVGEQRNILSATALEEKGIRLKRGTAYSIMDIKFNDGVLEIPTLKVQNYTEILFRNLMAMEESCGCGKLVGSYVFLVGRLVPEKADVRVLQRRGIMEGSGDKEDEVVNLFARMCVHVDLKDFYYGGLCEQVNGQIKIRRWSCIRKIMRIWERKFSSFKSCLKFALS